MKYLKLSILIFGIFNSYICSAQSGWFWQNPLPQGNDINAVKYIDTNLVLAIGVKGTILKSNNGGINWIVIYNDIESKLNNMFVLRSNFIIVVGDEGTIVKSTDGGNFWVSMLFSENCNLNGVFFLDEQTGWLCGFNTLINHSEVYKTTDGGQTWILNYIGIDNDIFLKIQFIDHNTGWIGGYVLYRTFNGGQTWEVINTNAQSSDFYFKDPMNGVLVGGYAPSPFGRTWQTTNSGLNYSFSFTYIDTFLTALSIPNSSVGFATGWKGKILKTTNYGISWSRCMTNINIDLYGVSFINGNSGVSVGKLGTIIRTTNSGINWNQANSGGFASFEDCLFRDINTGWISSRSGVIKTTNGGVSWNAIWDSSSSVTTRYCFINNSTGWIVHEEQAGIYSFKIYKTSDSGQSWTYLSKIEPGYPVGIQIMSIKFVNENTGFMVGYMRYPIPQGETFDGIYFKTINGGLNWVQILYNQIDVLYDIQFIDNLTGFMIGTNNAILKTTNTGTNWEYKYSIYSSINYKKLSFVNANTGWILGVTNQGISKICKTTNSGANFEDQLPEGNPGVNSIFFFDENSGWAAAIGGKLYATSNGGANWYYQHTPVSSDLYSVYFVTPLTGWITGKNSSILKTLGGITTSGISFHQNSSVVKFHLSQNYPNPFNPQTKIKFDVPANVKGQTSNVKLVIYDLLGREIATLVNEELRPGTYEADWDASNFSSDVYFYKIISGDFAKKKKMVLMK